MNITDDEKQVIEILIGFGPTADAYTAPLHAVSKAMKWESAETSKVVEDLVSRGLIQKALGKFKGYQPGETLTTVQSH
jgi:hypothetical protein